MTKLPSNLMLLAAVTSLLGACTKTNSTGSARIVVSLHGSALTSSAVAKVSIQVTGPGITDPIVASLTRASGQWSAILAQIPSGAGRTIHADAYDCLNTKIYQGSAVGVTILPNVTAGVEILAQQVTPPPPYANQAPRIDSVIVSADVIAVGETVTITTAAHDPDAGDTIAYAWQDSCGTFSNATIASPLWTAPATAAVCALTLTVTDPKGATASVTFNITAAEITRTADADVSLAFNNWPDVRGVDVDNAQVDVNESTQVQVHALDSDGDPLQFAWTASCLGSFNDATSANPTFTPSAIPDSKDCTLVVTVTDGRGGSNTGNVLIHVGNRPYLNKSPVIDSTFQSSRTVYNGAPITLRVKAHDPESAVLTFTWALSSVGDGALGVPVDGRRVGVDPRRGRQDVREP